MFKFKSMHEFSKRQQMANDILSRHKEHIPIIVEAIPKTSLPDIEKHKYLVPKEFTLSQFIIIIRKRIKMTSEQSIYLFINNSIPRLTDTVWDAYQRHKDPDGFLYILYGGETSFGKSLKN